MFLCLQHFKGRKVCYNSKMGLGWTHKQEFKIKSTCTTNEKRWLMQVECKWFGGFKGTTLNTSFTWPATFGRRPSSLPYNILHDSPWSYIQMTFFPRLSSGHPKIGTFIVSKLWTLIFISNKICFENEMAISYSAQKNLSNGV